MKYDFTAGSRNALNAARKWSVKLKHRYVGPEHILLGLLVPRDRVVEWLLGELGVAPKELRSELLASLEPGTGPEVRLRERPYTSRGRKVLEFAMAEARDLGDRHVGTEHLVLGLLREEEGAAARVFKAMGVTPEEARSRVRVMRDSQVEESSGRVPRSRRANRRGRGMKYNFTEGVRRVLALAREESIRLEHGYVGTEHILLGLLREGEGTAAAVLADLGVDLDGIRERVETSVRKGKAVVQRGELPYTSRGKKVLELSMGAARDLGDHYVGTRHLLLGLLLEEKGIAAQVLMSAHVTADEVRRRLLEIRGSGGDTRGDEAGEGTGASPAAPDSVWFLEVDPDAEAPIYEQIVARIEEAVATGRLEEGERLPPIRQLAEELGIAPGTVARAYSALEERGVLETEGARGTRVAPRAASAAADEERSQTLEGLLRPVVVAAYHLGATADQIRRALDRAMKGIYGLLA